MSNHTIHYLKTVSRLEPEINPIDADAAYASVAISLKRIADALEKIAVVAIEAYDWARNMP